MSEVLNNLKYAKSHEWVQDNGDGTVTVGISDHAQGLLGDLVYIELPEEGASFSVGEACAVVESVKAASDVYMPVSGDIVAVNEELADTPETVNNSPYGDGWIFKIKMSEPAELEELFSADDYQNEIAEDE